MRDGLGLVEQALLEADVSFSVVKDFMAEVTEQAVGEKVLQVARSDPAAGRHRPPGAGRADGPGRSIRCTCSGDVTVLMLCGLQGSGKTTTCGKLGRAAPEEQGRKPMLVAADLQRPAAIEQLQVIGEQLGMPVYADQAAQRPGGVCQAAVERRQGRAGPTW